jgi:uncharacterized protein (DUF58 family)
VETTDLIKKIRNIEIRTRGLTRQVFAGEYHSAFKGRGMSFSEVREYQYGDDIRSIDWNVTARYNHPYVKIFEEERELTVMLLVDISASGNFGTRLAYKRERITEIAALLAFSAIHNNDKIGVMLFSDRVEKFISPQKGRKHILRIIKDLLEFNPESTNTSLDEPLRFLTNGIKKRCTAFVISDFMSPDYEQALRIASKKHDLVALRVYDRSERSLPDIGLIKGFDPESNTEAWIDTSSRYIRRVYENWWINQQDITESIMKKCGVDNVIISTDEDYVLPLIKLFKMR